MNCLSVRVGTTTQDKQYLAQYIRVNMDTIPESTMKLCAFEFANIQYKVGTEKSGNGYLLFVEKNY